MVAFAEANWQPPSCWATAQVSRQTIISLENGKYNPSIILAYKLAKIFDTTIEELFIFEETDLQ